MFIYLFLYLLYVVIVGFSEAGTNKGRQTGQTTTLRYC